jgi:hypothetical protein
VEVARD